MSSNHSGGSAAVKILLGFFCMVLGTLGAGCASQRTPMQVDVTPLASYDNAAKPPDCKMPILAGMPLTTYRQIAIVEAWADLKDDTSDVLPALRRKACETGADALVILNSQHQNMRNLLYGAMPDESMSENTKQNALSGQSTRITEMEHTRRIGEAGHSGFYLDAVAITYTKPENKRTSDDAIQTHSKPNG